MEARLTAPSRTSKAKQKAARRNGSRQSRATAPGKLPTAMKLSAHAVAPQNVAQPAVPSPPPRNSREATVGVEDKAVTAATPAQSEPSLPALDRSKEKTITVKEAAFRLGKNPDTIYLWLRSGRLRGWQPGGRSCAVLVSEASVAKALSYALHGRSETD